MPPQNDTAENQFPPRPDQQIHSMNAALGSARTEQMKQQPLTYQKGAPYATSYSPHSAQPPKWETEGSPSWQLPPQYQASVQHHQPWSQANAADSARAEEHANAFSCPASGHYTPSASQKGKEGRRRRKAYQTEKKTAASASQPLLHRLLLIVCAVVFAVSAFLLIRYFVNILITRRASAQLEAVYSAVVENTEAPTPTPVPTASPAPVEAVAPVAEKQPRAQKPAATQAPAELWPSRYPQNPMLRVSSVFYELQRQNEDIIGWLKIDGVLEEAVVQRDNEYYLTHNALKQRSVTGALFLDETCDLKTVPTQMLVHGHNMKEGAMFGSLKKYKVKDASFYKAHPYIEFNTVYENSRFVIFAVAEVDLRWNKGDYLPFWENVRFSSADSFMNYVKKARDLSHYRCNVDVVPGDRLLTLSTCTGNDDNKRLIVMARRIRDNEDLTQLNMAVLMTGDR